jgi:hypothetical protein
MRIRVKFYPRDAWIGAYFDDEERKVVFCLLPCFPIIFDAKPQSRILYKVISRLTFTALICLIFSISTLFRMWELSLTFFLIALMIHIVLAVITDKKGA